VAAAELRGKGDAEREAARAEVRRTITLDRAALCWLYVDLVGPC
jgi:hypothetical protein